MPAATAAHLRQRIFELTQVGHDASSVARQLSVPPRTVRHLLAQWGGNPAPQFAPRRPPGRPLDSDLHPLLRCCVRLRRDNPGWGGGRIRVELCRLHPDADVPPRTLQRWLKDAGLTPPPALLVRHPDDRRASEPHQVWQMDAVEGLSLLDGSGACWLRVSDERSGAILLTEVFARPRWSEVPAAQTQEALRAAFARYGLPGAVRVDNGVPCGIPGGLPSGLGLWLAGLAVTMHRNDPRSPKQNAVVERTQGVSQRWVAPGRCADVHELRARLSREDHVQREEYPAVNGTSRRQAYPTLCNSGRGYARGCEALMWDLNEALGLLVRYRVRRKVSKRGQVSAYHRRIEVGQQNGGCWVYVGLDARTVEWVISDAQDREIRRRPAPELTEQTLLKLQLAGS